MKKQNPSKTDLIFQLSQEGKILVCYGDGFKKYGFLHTDLKDTYISDYLGIDDSTLIMKNFKKSKSSHNSIYLESRLSWNGVSGFFEITIFPGSDGISNLIFHDATECRLMKKTLQQSEFQFRIVFDSIGDHISVIDKDLRILLVNKAFREWNASFGLNTEMEGQLLFEIFPFLPKSVETEYRKVFSKGKTLISEDKNMLNEMEIFTETRKIPVLGEEGINRVVTIIRDITEEVALRNSISESEQRFRELAELSPQTICEADLEGRILYVNRNGMEKFGYIAKDLEQGLKVYDMIIPEQVTYAMQQLQPLLENKILENVEYTGLKKDGIRFPVLISSALMRKDGIPVGVRAVVVDISQRKKDEEELQKSQKLESVGILAGGIAHDFNNILTAVLGNLSLVRMQTDQNDPRYPILEAAQKATLRASDLTRQLLTFSRGGYPVMETASIRDLTKECVEFVMRGANVAYNFNFEENLHLVNIDKGQISQVIQNIVINANQAMPDGGFINISAKNIHVKKSKKLPVESGNYVLLSFQDSGPGISEDVAEKIFDPYFSTKSSGNGLGLSIVYSILKKHNGLVTFSSKVSKGTTFKIYLPVSEKNLPSQEQKPSIIFGTGSILLMDDEKDIRESTSLMIKRLGFEVELSSNGEEACRLYKERFDKDKKFNAVILDLTIPGGMGGKEAVQNMLEIDPNLKAIVSSGYSSDAVIKNYNQYGFCAAVLKPYTLETLSATFNRVLTDDC